MNYAGRSAPVDSPQKQRLTLTFSVEGLAAREELLFKGYVRLLDYLTEHNWQCCEPSAAQRIDLLVTDERAQPTRYLQAADKIQPVLQLGPSKSVSHAFFLSWPLKPYELETELNRLGHLIKGASTSGQVVGAQNSTAELIQPVPAQMQYRLSRWPKSSLLAEPGSMRLATLLTGRGLGLEELVSRSALSQAICERFIAVMQAENLIVQFDAPNSQIAPRTAPTIAKPGMPALPARQASQPAIKAITQPGLLARIRMRFGIKA